MGFFIEEVVRDSLSPIGYDEVPARDAFAILSPNVVLDFSPPQIGNAYRIRFHLLKGSIKFSARIILMPRQKGVFLLGLYDGSIEDAFCNAGISVTWGELSPLENVRNFEDFTNIQLRTEIKEILLKERRGFYISVE